MNETTVAQERILLAILVVLGVLLHRVEALLPLPTPWIKLGLANIMTMIALVFLGAGAAFTVTLLRIFLGSLLGGTFLGPTFFLSLAGGLAAWAVMALIYRRKNTVGVSLVGVSVLSAYAHTGAIFICVYFLFIHQEIFLKLLPFFFMVALVTGVLTGIVANRVAHHLIREKIFAG